LIIINREATPLDGRADQVIRESIGETLAAVIEKIDGPPAVESPLPRFRKA
jgi:hypothetical protein